MNTTKKGLGRGLGAIFEIENPHTPPQQTSTSSFKEVEIGMISPNPKQPRTHFDEDSLGELADSIRALGVIQPITVKSEGERYVIISGERRWRASQLAGLTTIPVYMREADDQTLHEMALVENIQRQDLNPIEVAISLQRLIDECNLTQDTLSTRVGKKRSTIANYMRLLRLPIEVQSAVKDEYISMGHAKAIAGAPEGMQIAVLKKTIKKSLSVRQTEELVKKICDGKPLDAELEPEVEFPDSYTRLVEHLERFFTQDISIKKGKKGGGKIVIDFENDNDIAQFLKKFEQIK